MIIGIVTGALLTLGVFAIRRNLAKKKAAGSAAGAEPNRDDKIEYILQSAGELFGSFSGADGKPPTELVFIPQLGDRYLIGQLDTRGNQREVFLRAEGKYQEEYGTLTSSGDAPVRWNKAGYMVPMGELDTRGNQRDVYFNAEGDPATDVDDPEKNAIAILNSLSNDELDVAYQFSKARKDNPDLSSEELMKKIGKGKAYGLFKEKIGPALNKVSELSKHPNYKKGKPEYAGRRDGEPRDKIRKSKEDRPQQKRPQRGSGQGRPREKKPKSTMKRGRGVKIFEATLKQDFPTKDGEGRPVMLKSGQTIRGTK